MPWTTDDRVSANTDKAINEEIRRKTEMSIAYYVQHTDEIPRRVQELGEEWDIERALEATSAGLSLFGLVYGLAFSRKWLVLPLVVQGFFMQHAVQGWCPPLGVFRRLGFRTRREIDTERFALKALRGDFQDLPSSPEARGTAPVLQAVQR
jgi:hypothetical protein